MGNYNCLIVDDEKELAAATCEYFQMFDVSCDWVSTSAECETFLKENTIDVLLLDINLDEESGFNLCKKIRQVSNVPILFISARQSDDDVLIALNIGGDDYIKKPYTLSVLLAKVKVVIKRAEEFRKNNENEKQQVKEEKESVQIRNVEQGQEQGETDSVMTDNRKSQNIYLIPEQMKVNVKGKEVALKAKEYKLFSYLYENANRIISKDELFIAVWGDAFFSDGTLNVHIRKLREKLEEDPNAPKLIKTVWGTGYICEL